MDLKSRMHVGTDSLSIVRVCVCVCLEGVLWGGVLSCCTHLEVGIGLSSKEASLSGRLYLLFHAARQRYLYLSRCFGTPAPTSMTNVQE